MNIDLRAGKCFPAIHETHRIHRIACFKWKNLTKAENWTKSSNFHLQFVKNTIIIYGNDLQ